MYEHFKPLLWCMGAAGLYHEPPPEDASWPRKIFSTRTYCLIISVLLWLNWLRYIPIFFLGIHDFRPFELLSFCWFLQGALNGLICFRACAKKDHMAEFIRMWNIFKADNEMKREDLTLSRREIWPWLIACLIFSWSFIALDFFMYLAGLLGMFERGQVWLNTYLKPFPLVSVNYAICLIIEIFLTSAWIFPFSLIIVTTIGLIKIASNFERNMEEDMDAAQDQWPWSSSDTPDETKTSLPISQPPDIKKWRKCHLKICDLVQQLDKDYGMIILTFSLVAVPKLCYITYNLIHTLASGFTTRFHAMNVYWFVFTVLNITLILVSANILHEKVNNN